MKVKFIVLGEPQGKGRPKAAVVVNRKTREPIKSTKTGRFVISARTPENTVIYENLIITEYRRQVGNVRFKDDEPLDLRVIAYYSIPSSVSKKMQTMMESGEIRPMKKPDYDNIAKVVSDALNGIAYKDDKQIVDAQQRKFYSRQPRIEVTILTANK